MKNEKSILFCLFFSLILMSCGTAPKVGDHQTNPEHLDKLMEGVQAWNDWRVQNPHIIPDLENADLNQANLEKFDLLRAVMSNANLSNANLRGADLSMADLSEAILTGTKYDSRTKWQEGFDPVAAGAILVAQ